MNQNADFVSYRWFPAANIGYYVARPFDRKVFCIGKPEDIHQYAWINTYNGGFRKDMDMYFITSSHDFKNPAELYAGYFNTIELSDTIPVIRDGTVTMNFFIYRLQKLKVLPKPFSIKSFSLDRPIQ